MPFFLFAWEGRGKVRCDRKKSAVCVGGFPDVIHQGKATALALKGRDNHKDSEGSSKKGNLKSGDPLREQSTNERCICSGKWQRNKQGQ